jgi:hypothetical protein
MKWKKTENRNYPLDVNAAIRRNGDDERDRVRAIARCWRRRWTSGDYRIDYVFDESNQTWRHDVLACDGRFGVFLGGGIWEHVGRAAELAEAKSAAEQHRAKAA